MKKILKLGLFLFLTGQFIAQNDSIRQRECDRMRFLAGEELKVKNYSGAITYYLKGETLCGDYDQATYNRISTTVQNAYATEKEKVKKAKYADTLLQLMDRMESKGFLDKSQILNKGKFLLRATKPNRALADGSFQLAMNSGIKMSEVDIYTYYSNVYMLYADADVSDKEAFKNRLVTEYLIYVNDFKNEKIKAATKQYFENVISSCDDLLPDLKAYMSKLPPKKEDKLTMINMFMDLIANMKCTDSPEYEMLVDSVIAIDNSIDAVLAKKKLLFAKKEYDGAIEQLKTAKEMSGDDSVKNAFDYEILEITYFNKKNTRTAYNLALDISGEYRSKALEIAADVVASQANSCGVSTFDRKCNYLYAAQLADRAGLSGKADRYRKMGPTNTDIFENGSPTSATLSCWGVTVNL